IVVLLGMHMNERPTPCRTRTNALFKTFSTQNSLLARSAENVLYFTIIITTSSPLARDLTATHATPSIGLELSGASLGEYADTPHIMVENWTILEV
ncbi:hypothetical protein DACRYDRAFT_25579, partial [Dacryopinax primogenitus]